MPRKGQKNVKSPAVVPSRKPSPSPGRELSQEKPPYAVDTRKVRATSEAKRSPIETSKMADNCKELKVSDVAAHSELPVAFSSKSTLSQLEVFHTRQASRSPDVSSKKENADINATSIESSARAPKRSGTPLPKSFFEDNAKKMRMTPTHLGLDSPKPTQLEGESYHKSDPKPNQNQENNNKENENPGVLRLTNESNEEDGPIADNVDQSMWITGKGLLNQFQKFNDDYRARNIKLQNSNVEKRYENIALRSRLNEMANHNKSLKNRLARQMQLGMEWKEKLKNTIEMPTAIENNSKSLIDQQKAELHQIQSEIHRLKAEASDWSDLQQKLKQTKATAAYLLYENNKQAAELEEQKLKMQNTVAELGDFKNKYYQLQSELIDKTLECDGLNQKELNFDRLLLLNTELENRIVELEATHLQNKMFALQEDLKKKETKLIAVVKPQNYVFDALKKGH